MNLSKEREARANAEAKAAEERRKEAVEEKRQQELLIDVTSHEIRNPVRPPPSSPSFSASLLVVFVLTQLSFTDLRHPSKRRLHPFLPSRASQNPPRTERSLRPPLTARRQTSRRSRGGHRGARQHHRVWLGAGTDRERHSWTRTDSAEQVQHHAGRVRPCYEFEEHLSDVQGASLSSLSFSVI